MLLDAPGGFISGLLFGRGSRVRWCAGVNWSFVVYLEFLAP